MICPNCKSENFISHENRGAKFAICNDCGFVIEVQSSEEHDKFCEEQEVLRPKKDEKPTVECPYCHSTNTKKISTASKAGSVALVGIFALGKVSKQWHCNDCKSDF